MHLCYYSGTELKHAQSDDGVIWSFDVIHELDDPDKEYVDCALTLDEENYGINIAYLIREGESVSSISPSELRYTSTRMSTNRGRPNCVGWNLDCSTRCGERRRLTFYNCGYDADLLGKGLTDGCWPGYSMRRLADGVVGLVSGLEPQISSTGLGISTSPTRQAYT